MTNFEHNSAINWGKRDFGFLIVDTQASEQFETIYIQYFVALKLYPDPALPT